METKLVDNIDNCKGIASNFWQRKDSSKKSYGPGVPGSDKMNNPCWFKLDYKGQKFSFLGDHIADYDDRLLDLPFNIPLIVIKRSSDNQTVPNLVRWLFTCHVNSFYIFHHLLAPFPKLPINAGDVIKAYKVMYYTVDGSEPLPVDFIIPNF